ncbi:uncharacterized protein [Antedon mediterranea]|uniref:uncharacterized protein n=1 Tax=Antedon mediterranea TaxID=105859 RepID=UPI003AF53B0D
MDIKIENEDDSYAEYQSTSCSMDNQHVEPESDSNTSRMHQQLLGLGCNISINNMLEIKKECENTMSENESNEEAIEDPAHSLIDIEGKIIRIKTEPVDDTDENTWGQFVTVNNEEPQKITSLKRKNKRCSKTGQDGATATKKKKILSEINTYRKKSRGNKKDNNKDKKEEMDYRNRSSPLLNIGNQLPRWKNIASEFKFNDVKVAEGLIDCYYYVKRGDAAKAMFGEQYKRWLKVRKNLNFNTHEELTEFLLNSYYSKMCKTQQTPEESITTTSNQKTTKESDSTPSTSTSRQSEPSLTNMAKKEAATWSDDETHHLIDIWSESEIKNELTSNKNTKDVWNKIRLRLVELGHTERPEIEIRSKIKNLLQMYRGPFFTINRQFSTRIHELMVDSSAKEIALLEENLEETLTEQKDNDESTECEVIEDDNGTEVQNTSKNGNQCETSAIIAKEVQALFLSKADDNIDEDNANLISKRKMTSYWTDFEINDLIEIWSQPEIRSITESSKNVSKQFVWAEIAQRLSSRCHNKTWKQVKQKVKDLRAAYKICHYSGPRSETEVLKVFPFYHKIQNLMKKSLSDVLGNSSLEENIKSLVQDDDDDDSCILSDEESFLDEDEQQSDTDNEFDRLRRNTNIESASFVTQRQDEAPLANKDQLERRSLNKKRRASRWSDTETYNLIEIWSEPKIRRVIESHRKSSKKWAWNEIAKRLTCSPHKRTWMQVQVKIKGLRQSFRLCNENPKSEFEIMRVFPFYYKLQELFKQSSSDVLDNTGTAVEEEDFEDIVSDEEFGQDEDETFDQHPEIEQPFDNSEIEEQLLTDSSVVESTHKRKRDINWRDTEINHLIDVWSEPDIKHITESTHKNKTKAWAEMAKRLGDRGPYIRNWIQIQHKVKDLRRLYKLYQDRPEAEIVKVFPFYFKMKELIKKPLADVSDSIKDNANTSMNDALSDEDSYPYQEDDILDENEEIDSEVILLDCKQLSPQLHQNDVNQLESSKMKEDLSKQKRVNWTEKEVHLLLDIWCEPDIKRVIESNEAKKGTFVKIARRLADCGPYDRNWIQIQRKIKDLRRTFKVFSEAGPPSEVEIFRTFPFYYKMKGLMKFSSDVPDNVDTFIEDDSLEHSHILSDEENYQGGDEEVFDENEELENEKLLDSKQLLDKQQENTEPDNKEENQEDQIVDESNEMREDDSKTSKQKRILWTEKEVNHLLNIWCEPEIKRVIDSHETKKGTFVEIARRLADCGPYDRNWIQIQRKIKDLRRAYKVFNDAGPPSEVEIFRTFPFYYKMKGLIKPYSSYFPENVDESVGDDKVGFELSFVLSDEVSSQYPNDGEVFDEIKEFDDIEEQIMCSKSLDNRNQHTTMQPNSKEEEKNDNKWQHMREHGNIQQNWVNENKNEAEEMNRNQMETKQDQTLNRRRAFNWADIEVYHLLDIWAQPEIKSVLDSHKTKKGTFVEMARRLAECGPFYRNWIQIQRKIKDLKRAYKVFNDTGPPSETDVLATFPFYYKMKELLNSSLDNSLEENVSSSFKDEDFQKNKQKSVNIQQHGKIQEKDQQHMFCQQFNVDENEEGHFSLQKQDIQQFLNLQPENKLENFQHGSKDQPLLLQQLGHNNTKPGNKQNVSREGEKESIVLRSLLERSKQQFQDNKDEKREKETLLSEKSFLILTRKMDGIAWRNTRTFTSSASKRRQEKRLEKAEERYMTGLLDFMKQDLEDKRLAEERRSKEFQTMLAALRRNFDPNMCTSNKDGNTNS